MGHKSHSARILIADDHPLFRKGLTAILSSQREFEVVGEASDGQEALRLCQRLRPDLVLMDITMPRMDGIEATREAKECCPGTVVLVVTAHEDEDLMLKAIRAGAAGYILKRENPKGFIAAVREALSGEFPMYQRLAARLLRRLAAQEASQQREPEPAVEENEPKGSPPVSLTPRELEVLRRVAAGKTNRTIAQELHMSLSTVKRHVERVVSKLGVSDRTQAAVRAIELGLLPA